MKTINTLRWILPAIAAGAALYLFSACNRSKTNDGTPALTEVDVARPIVDSIVLHKSYPATLISFQDVDIVARVNGYITAQLYDDGDYVKAGQPLFTIESTTYVQALNEAEAQLQTARATHEYNSKQCEAMKKALLSDAVSKMDVIQAESALKESEASIKTAQAAVENARLMLSYCTVRAPFAGHASASILLPGSFVAGENSPVVLTTVYDDSSVSANFAVEDTRVLELRNSPAAAKIDYNHIPVQFGDSIPNKYTGRLDYTAPAVNKSTGTVPMRIKIDNSNGELRSGMFATVLLPYAVDPKAIIVKDASIGTDQLGKYLYVVNDSNRIVYTPVKVGELYHDTLRVISEGLRPTDRYVTKALLKVRDGMEVKPNEVN